MTAGDQASNGSDVWSPAPISCRCYVGFPLQGRGGPAVGSDAFGHDPCPDLKAQRDRTTYTPRQRQVVRHMIGVQSPAQHEHTNAHAHTLTNDGPGTPRPRVTRQPALFGRSRSVRSLRVEKSAPIPRDYAGFEGSGVEKSLRSRPLNGSER